MDLAANTPIFGIYYSYAMKKIICTLSLVMFWLGGFAQADLSINATAPSNLPDSGCNLTASEDVRVVLVNTSGFPYSGTLEMGYSLNAGPAVTENVTIGMLPGSGTFIYTWPNPEDFSACQLHNLQVWVYDTSDPNNLNDTVYIAIESDCAPTLGTLSGTEGDTVCNGLNGGNIELNGYSGYPEEWLVSTDGGTSWTSNPVPGFDDTLAYSNVTTETIYKVVVGSLFGYCPDDTTSWFTLNVEGPSDAGVLPADFTICDNGNAGDIVVTGHSGDIIDWLESNDNGVTFTSTGVQNDSLSYTNLMDTMMYQVIVSTTFCPADTSAPVTLTLIPGSFGGTISGESVVCNQENDSSLVVSGYNGNVIAWWYSLDSGLTWLPTIAPGDSVYSYQNLQAGTIYFAAEVQEGSCQSAWSTPHVMDVLPLFTDAGPDTTIIEGDAIQLYAVGGANYFWYPDDYMTDPNVPDPIVNPDLVGTYVYNCIITDLNSCSDTATAIIIVAPDITDVIIPNLFTPNGDGFNDLWVINNIENFTESEVTVFNIYGQIVYQMAPYNNDWDGTYNGSNLPDGTYFYVLELNDPLYPDPLQGNVTITGND